MSIPVSRPLAILKEVYGSPPKSPITLTPVESPTSSPEGNGSRLRRTSSEESLESMVAQLNSPTKRQNIDSKHNLIRFTTTPDQVERREVPYLRQNSMTRRNSSTAVTQYMDSVPFLDRYLVGEELGRGKFGAVHSCLDVVSQQTYNVKVVCKKDLSQQAKEAFFKEVGVLRSLRHRNVMECTHLSEDDDCYYIVTPALKGGSLMSRMKLGRMPESEVRIVSKQILEALAYCHENTVVHRDVKSENIVFNEANGLNITVVDFGLADVASFKSNHQLTRCCGSLDHMAPETIRCAQGGGEVGYSWEVDVWSFGVLLYTMLCGRYPFADAESARELASLILEGVYDMDSQEWDSICPEAVSLVESCLVVDPKKRITAKEALRHPFYNMEE